MDDADFMNLAHNALPERMRALPARVIRLADGTTGVANTQGPGDRELLETLHRKLNIPLGGPLLDQRSADVEYHEQTDLGHRLTVVQIRDGAVKRIISQA